MLVDVAPGDSIAVLTYRAATPHPATVFIQATRSQTTVSVRDSLAGRLLGRGVAAPGAAPALLDARTDAFMVPADTTLLVEARPLEPDSGGALRLVLHRIDPDPEHRSADVAVGDTVLGERLETSADVDAFVLAGQAGDELVVFLQPVDPFRRDGLVLTVFANDSTIATAVNREVGNDPEAHSSGRFTLPPGGGYHIAVTGTTLPPSGPLVVSGAYVFELYRVDRSPETAFAVVGVHDTVAEAIDRVGDVDVFHLQGAGGDTVNLFVQATAGPPGARIAAVRPGLFPGFPFNDSLESTVDDPELFSRASGLFVVPDTGLTLEVIGLADRGPVLHRGSYRFLVYRPNDQPETAAATIAIGDTVAGESVELPGDVDRFAFAGASTDSVEIVLEALPGFDAGILVLRLRSPDGTQLGVAVADRIGGGTTGTTGGIRLGVAGTFTARVEGLTDRQGAGPYRFTVFRR